MYIWFQAYKLCIQTYHAKVHVCNEHLYSPNQATRQTENRLRHSDHTYDSILSWVVYFGILSILIVILRSFAISFKSSPVAQPRCEALNMAQPAAPVFSLKWSR